MYHSNLLGGLAAKSIGIKKIIWGIRTTDAYQCSSKLTVYLSKLCAKLSYYIPSTIISAANVSKNYHIKIGYDESKMVVIPNEFDLEELTATDEDGLEIRRQNNLTEDDIVIGSVGRFNPVKNQKLFVDVAALLIKEHPNLKFLIVGREDTTKNKELMSWLNSYKIADSFRLLGQRDDVAKCLKAMNVFCLHSKTEGFSNVLCEAMYAGLTCISTDVGGAQYIIQNFGFFVEKDNEQQLSDCIRNIIDKSKLTTLKKQSKKHIVDIFSIDKISQEYLKVWQSEPFPKTV